MIKKTRLPYVADTARGKSFNFSDWDLLTSYTNNTFKQDFVQYNGALYVCINSVEAGEIDPQTDTNNGAYVGEYWQQIVKGVKGNKGDIGKTYIPNVDSNGDLSWKEDDGKSLPKTVNIRGPKGSPGGPGKPGKNGLSAYDLARKHGYKGSEAAWIDALEKSHKGEIPKNIILRVDTDPALFPDENYCGTHIQWKYDSEDYKEWNNLIQINQLMNIALSGLNLNYKGLEEKDGNSFYHLALDYNEIDYMDAKNNVVLGPKIRTISDVYIPVYSGVNPNDPAKIENTVFVFDKNASCEKYFYIYDPNNSGWTLENNLDWVEITPGGADTAFSLQEGKDSALTPCETVVSDSTITGTGSTLVIICVDENTKGISRTGEIKFTNSKETISLTINQKAI